MSSAHTRRIAMMPARRCTAATVTAPARPKSSTTGNQRAIVPADPVASPRGARRCGAARPRRCRVRRRRSRSETRSVGAPGATRGRPGRRASTPRGWPTRARVPRSGTPWRRARRRMRAGANGVDPPIPKSTATSVIATNACTTPVAPLHDRADDRSCEDRDAQIVADLLLQIPTGPRRREHRSRGSHRRTSTGSRTGGGDAALRSARTNPTSTVRV